MSTSYPNFSGPNKTFVLPDATDGSEIAVSTGTQELGGAKTFTGTVKFGKSGTVGAWEIYPATASKGKTTFGMADNTGDTTTALTVAAQAGARTYTIPDAGASASFAMTQGATTIAGQWDFTLAPTVGTVAGLYEVTIKYGGGGGDIAASSFFNANRAWTVVGIRGRPTTLEAGKTISLRKATSGTNATSGVLLHSGSFDCNGTADTVQSLTLTATAADLDLAVGDALTFHPSAGLVSAVGSITVLLKPK